MLERVAIYSHNDGQKTKEVILRLVDEFCRKGIKIQLYEKSDDICSCPGGLLIEKFKDLGSLPDLPDLVLSVGGDGTFLETMLKVYDLGIPVAGVNTGRLGFLEQSGSFGRQSEFPVERSDWAMACCVLATGCGPQESRDVTEPDPNGPRDGRRVP